MYASIVYQILQNAVYHYFEQVNRTTIYSILLEFYQYALLLYYTCNTADLCICSLDV